MNAKYDNDLSQRPSKPIARIEHLVSALEEILAEKPENKLIQAAIPRLMRNIKEYSLLYHYEIIDGHAFYFEIERIASNVSRTRKISYDEALNSLLKGLFSGEYPELASLQEVFQKYNLMDVIQSATADYSSTIISVP